MFHVNPKWAVFAGPHLCIIALYIVISMYLKGEGIHTRYSYSYTLPLPQLSVWYPLKYNTRLYTVSLTLYFGIVLCWQICVCPLSDTDYQ